MLWTLSPAAGFPCLKLRPWPVGQTWAARCVQHSRCCLSPPVQRPPGQACCRALACRTWVRRCQRATSCALGSPGARPMRRPARAVEYRENAALSVVAPKISGACRTMRSFWRKILKPKDRITTPSMLISRSPAPHWLALCAAHLVAQRRLHSARTGCPAGSCITRQAQRMGCCRALVTLLMSSTSSSAAPRRPTGRRSAQQAAPGSGTGQGCTQRLPGQALHNQAATEHRLHGLLQRLG